jgi:putative SOS response-associated peptidase YedK
MPVILPPELYARWLDPRAGGFVALRPLLGPFPADAMIAHRVGPAVNDPRHDDALCLEPA